MEKRVNMMGSVVSVGGCARILFSHRSDRVMVVQGFLVFPGPWPAPPKDAAVSSVKVDGQEQFVAAGPVPLSVLLQMGPALRIDPGHAIDVVVESEDPCAFVLSLDAFVGGIG